MRRKQQPQRIHVPRAVPWLLELRNQPPHHLLDAAAPSLALATRSLALAAPSLALAAPSIAAPSLSLASPYSAPSPAARAASGPTNEFRSEAGADGALHGDRRR